MFPRKWIDCKFCSIPFYIKEKGYVSICTYEYYCEGLQEADFVLQGGPSLQKHWRNQGFEGRMAGSNDSQEEMTI